MYLFVEINPNKRGCVCSKASPFSFKQKPCSITTVNTILNTLLSSCLYKQIATGITLKKTSHLGQSHIRVMSASRPNGIPCALECPYLF